VSIFVVALVAGVAFFIFSRKHHFYFGKRKEEDPDTSVAMSQLYDGVKTVKDIQVLERLGGGNFSDVYRGVMQRTIIVALKKLKDMDQFEEFAREAALLHQLDHTNIGMLNGFLYTYNL
jgi:hypothetical protein